MNGRRGASARKVHVETLERRVLLAVSFSPGALTAPINRPDLALGTVSNFAPIEPMIKVNPSNPANVVPSSHRGARISTNGGASFGAAFNFSNPAGTTVFNGDTDMAFDASGRLYWVNMAGVGTAGISVSRINPSTGASFSSVNFSNNNDDKPFIAADTNPLSPFANNVYVVWSRFGTTNIPVMFTRSTDLGLTWSTPIALTGAAESFAWPSDVAVAPNGDVYVAFHANGEGPTSGRTLVRRSTDGGASFGTATQAFLSGQSAVTYNVQTASTTTIPGTQFWTQGTVQPWILPDPARPGNVYVVTNDDPNNIYRNGDDADIVFARSTNNGATWTRSTISSGPGNSFQLFPTAAIDQFGNIVVAWYDNRRGLTNGAGRFLLDVMATYSTDGGLTWAPEFRLNDQAFDPDPGAVNRFNGPPPTTRIGEYFGIDIFGNTAHVAWNGNTFSGSTPIGQQVWYSSFALAGELTITGDDGGAATDDQIVVRRLTGNNDWIDITVNGQRQYAGLLEGISRITIDGGGGNDLIQIDATGATLPITIAPSAGSDTVQVNSLGAGSANVVFAGTHRLQSLSIGSGGIATLSPAGNSVLTVASLSVGGTGVLDLTDNSMIVDYMGGSPMATIQSYLSGGYSNGAWNGPGINSSTAASLPGRALGYSEASDLFTVFPAVFAGQLVDNTSVLITYTRYGDADLNRLVNLVDFNRLASNFGQTGRRWNHGNFDYDPAGLVGLTDFNRLASNFGLTNATVTDGDFTFAGTADRADFNILAGRFGTSLGTDGQLTRSPDALPAAPWSGQRIHSGSATLEDEAEQLVELLG